MIGGNLTFGIWHHNIIMTLHCNEPAICVVGLDSRHNFKLNMTILTMCHGEIWSLGNRRPSHPNRMTIRVLNPWFIFFRRVFPCHWQFLSETTLLSECPWQIPSKRHGWNLARQTPKSENYTMMQFMAPKSSKRCHFSRIHDPEGVLGS